MASSINASTTAGVVTTADTSGVLNIQTAGTTAISIDASQAVSFTNSANLPNTFGFKNRIINGAMVIDQRNAGAAVTGASSFPVDRFFMRSVNDGAYSGQQDSSAPAGFTKSTKITVTTADSSLTTTQSLSIRQRVEGFNISDFGWGASGAATVTLSFWVRSSVTGTYGGSICNGNEDRSYPFTFAISSANTWEQKSVTIAGDTSGTWATDNSTGLNVFFSVGAGPDRSGTAGAWSGNTYYSATGAVNMMATLNATWQITGVQLEKGATATSFDYRPYASEYFMCCRYFRYWGFSSAWESQTTSSSNHVTWQFPQPMRTLPTLVRIGNLITGRENGTAVTPYQYDASSGSASGTECYIYAQNTTGSTTPIAIGGRGSATAEL